MGIGFYACSFGGRSSYCDGVDILSHLATSKGWEKVINMNLSLYHKSLLVPAKCGTRYIDKLLGINSQLNTKFPTTTIWWNQSLWLDEMLNTDMVKIMIPSENLFQYHKLPITHIVLREPMDLLESALHTDLSGHHNTIISEGGGFESTNYELMKWLLPYTSTGTGHWSPDLYKGVWYLLQMRRDIQIIPLNNLSAFLSEQGIEGEYTATDWNFSGVSSRKWIIDSVKCKFPKIWSVIKTAVDRDSVYYEHICRGKILNLPKIIGLPKRKRKLI